MYYILIFSNAWTLYNATAQTSHPLTKEQVDVLKHIFPGITPGEKIFHAIQVQSINPSKLQQLKAPTAPTLASPK